MKKLTTLLFLLLSATAIMAQQTKGVAIWDIKVGGKAAVSDFTKKQIIAALGRGIVKSPGFKVYTRTDALEGIMKEQSFQRTGQVSDDQIRKLGEMKGVDFVLLTEVTKEDNQNNLVVTANILNIESGQYSDLDYEIIEDFTASKLDDHCVKLAQRLFGSIATTSGNNSNYSNSNNSNNYNNNYNSNYSNNTNSNSNNYNSNYNNNSYSKPATPAGYTDLGLPSGTKWKNNNESGFYTYDDAVKTFGNRLPSKAQLEELKSSCRWTWTGSGYKVTGPNGNSIDLPAAGYRSCNGSTYYVGSYGRYWSSTPSGSDKAWNLSFSSSSVGMYSDTRCYGRSVRLVQD